MERELLSTFFFFFFYEFTDLDASILNWRFAWQRSNVLEVLTQDSSYSMLRNGLLLILSFIKRYNVISLHLSI